MSSPFSTNNPGIGGLEELTSAEEAVVASIASLGSPTNVLAVNATGDGVEWVASGAFNLTVKETDGSPSVTAVDTLVFSNGSVTDDGGGQVSISIAGSGDVTAASNFATDNVLIRSDGTAKGVQSTGITVADTTNAMSGMGSITIDASGSLLFGAVTVLSDSAGVTTLSNVDAIDATTEATIESAIDTLPNLVSATGLSITESQVSDLGAYIESGSVAVSDFAASAIVIETEGISANDNDTTIPTSAAVKDYVDSTAINLDVYTDGNNNTFLGNDGGSIGATDTNNTAIGATALDGLNNSGATFNTAIGPQAMSGTTSGSYNVGIGPNALEDCTSGNNNVAIGRLALGDGTSPGNTIAIGYLAGQQHNTVRSVYIGDSSARFCNGADNVGIGYRAIYGVTGTTTAARNTVIGAGAGDLLETGSNNLLIGYQVGDNLTSGSGNILIGYDLNATGATTSNQLNIGGLITGDLSAGTISLNGDVSFDTGISSDIIPTTSSAYDLGSPSFQFGGTYTSELYCGYFESTGSNFIISDSSTNTLLRVEGSGTVANYPQFNATPTGNSIAFLAAGLDADISINLTPKGTGRVLIGGDGLDADGHAIGDSTETDNGNSGTADTIDWGAGNFQKSTLTGNVTYTFTAPPVKGRFQLMLVQDATGSRTATWPASVKWPGGTAPTLSTAANSIDIVTFYYDGTNYYGVISADFQ